MEVHNTIEYTLNPDMFLEINPDQRFKSDANNRITHQNIILLSDYQILSSYYPIIIRIFAVIIELWLVFA